jgi:hypothetical protein
MGQKTAVGAHTQHERGRGDLELRWKALHLEMAAFQQVTRLYNGVYCDIMTDICVQLSSPAHFQAIDQLTAMYACMFEMVLCCDLKFFGFLVTLIWICSTIPVSSCLNVSARFEQLKR